MQLCFILIISLFLERVFNQLFLPNESSVSQASYRTVVLRICFQLLRNKPFYGGRVVEKNETNGDVPVSNMGRVLARILKIGVKMLPSTKSWSFTILFY